MKHSTVARLMLWAGILTTLVSFLGVILTAWLPFVVSEAIGIALMVYAAVEISRED